MRTISLLDCTLRDGGYVNNWNYGENTIKGVIEGLVTAGVNILELGFMRNESPNRDRTAFATIEDVNNLIPNKKKGVVYSTMIEAFNPYDLSNLSPHIESGVDIIRVCVWKDPIVEHLEYCRGVQSKGYTISVQPSRVEQYDKEEFTDLVKRSNDLHPYAFYIVDTWGTQSSVQIASYAEIAAKYLDNDIKIGYHGHNNRMQALACAQTFLNLDLDHDLCLDSSVRGMGRGAGNLCTEIIMDYLNEVFVTNYDCKKVVDVYNKFIRQFYEKEPWGYSLYYYLSSIYGVNPNFSTYFRGQKYTEEMFEKFLKSLVGREKVVFSKDFVEERLSMLNLK